MTERPTAISVALNKAWPKLRYLSLGVWLAWLFLISSGMIWLSDTEFDGVHVAQLMLGMSLIGAVVCFAAPFFKERAERLLAKRSMVMGVAFAGGLGALAIIAAGPYYLNSGIFFWPGIVLISVFSSVFALKCGTLFGKLESRQVFLLALYSEILMVALSYFIIGNDFYFPIEGGPPLAGILAFALLPLIASWLLFPPSSSTELPSQQSKPSKIELGTVSRKNNSRNPVNSETPASTLPLSKKESTEKLRLPRDFWKLLFMLFFFTLVSEMFRNYFVSVRVPDITFIDAKMVLLLRLGFALVMLIYALRTDRNIRFSKMYLYSLVILAVVVSLIPLLMDQTLVLGSLTGGLSACMNLLIWCLLSMVVFEKSIPSLVVFGFGWGTILFARACGWFLGIGVLPLLMASPWASIVYWAVAILILLMAVLLFSESHLDKLFENLAKGQIPLGIAQSREQQSKEHRPWHEAVIRIGKRAMLSQRELEIFELVSTGRSPKNIAKHLVVSVNTVRSHIRNIYIKLNAHSNEELVEMIEQEISSQGDDSR